MTTIRAYLYKITITDSVLDHIHGFEHSIYEIYVPSLKLFFNHEGVFKAHTKRYENAEIMKIFFIEFESGSFIKQGLTAMEKGKRLAKDLLDITVKKYVKEDVKEK